MISERTVIGRVSFSTDNILSIRALGMNTRVMLENNLIPVVDSVMQASAEFIIDEDSELTGAELKIVTDQGVKTFTVTTSEIVITFSLAAEEWLELLTPDNVVRVIVTFSEP